jgi:hypothetical protein
VLGVGVWRAEERLQRAAVVDFHSQAPFPGGQVQQDRRARGQGGGELADHQGGVVGQVAQPSLGQEADGVQPGAGDGAGQRGEFQEAHPAQAAAGYGACISPCCHGA